MLKYRSWFSLAVWLLLPAFAPANTAAPWRSGQSVGEPCGLKAVRIDRETLTLNLRGFQHAGPAEIEATYHLYNTGETLTTDLVFVVGSLLGEGAGVWLDDQSVPHEQDAKPALPPSWQPPKQTPALAGTRPLHYSASGAALAFKVSLPPGAHQLRVKYLARPSAYSAGSPTLYWQLGYVLAPARDWAGFGKLDVKVTLPEGWAAASEPALERQGDELIGSFQGVPADALALTVQAPPRTPDWLLSTFNWTCSLLALLAAPVLIWRLSAALGRKLAAARQTSGWLVVCGLFAGLLWSAALVAAVFAISFVSSELSALPHQKAWAVDYGPVFFFLLALLGAAALAPLGTGLSLVAGYQAYRQGQRQLLAA